ncbi:unnamed protein product [Closterium sp. NIES-64]|nr:unnamed protein product [Closterium sp. NIES-64]
MERRPLYDQILMVLPPLLPLHHVLPSLRRAKVVTHAKKLLQLLISQLLGLPLAKHSFLSTTDGTPSSKYLWHVQTLYQPVIPHCTNPDLPLWKHFRRRFLLPTPPLPDPTADSTTPTPTLSSSSSSRSLTEENPSSALSDPSSPLERVPKVPPGFLDGARSVFPSLPALPVEGYAQGGDLHGSWVPIGWQVVVAHDSMRCTKALGQVEELLHRYFPADRIVVFSSSRKIMEGKHIFNRAALFITCLGLAITNTMFMPPRAAVLDLRPPIPVSHTTRYTLLSRSFASANDVRSFVLICQPGGDNDDVAAGSGQLECNTREIDDVIDRIAHDIYTSPAAVAAAMSPTRDAEAAAEALADAEASGRSLLRPTDLIRGSVLRGPLQVQKFRSWMKCVGQEGRWVYDPKPRRLPWWFMGKPYQCDSPMSGRHHGKSLGEADEIADARGDPEEWTVRETLKYKWGVPANACPKVPVRSWEVEEEETEGGRRYRGREARAVESGGDGRETMRMTMRFSHSSWMKFSPEKFCERVGRGRLFLFLGDSLNEQLSEAFLNNLVLSLPKPVSEEHLRMEIPSRFPEKLIIWRNTPPGHANCSGQKTPLKKRQDPGILPYNWDKFARQNKLAEVIVKRYGAAYMDVDSMTALRADGHKEFVPAVNKVDCLHYCHPGPLDGWVEHLYNTLSWLMAPPPVDA